MGRSKVQALEKRENLGERKMEEKGATGLMREKTSGDLRPRLFVVLGQDSRYIWLNTLRTLLSDPSSSSYRL